MKRVKYLGVAAMAFLALSSCVSRTNDGEKARADYAQSLEDSIKIVQVEIDSCDEQIKIKREQISEWMRDFTTVANPREAGSYMIMTSFKGKYPLTATGLAARINDNNQFELVGALSGKAFDNIVVQGPSVSVASSVVPNDQALNYHTAALTTVLFTGEKADSIGEMIADNELNPLKVTFMQGNRAVESWKLPTENAKVISYTYLLFNETRELNRLERRVPMLHEKINLLRLHKDK